MKTVSIIAATMSGNRGSEAMATTVICRLREMLPDTQFNLFSYYPADDAALLKDSRVRVFSATPFFLSTVLVPVSLIYRFAKVLRLTPHWLSSVTALAESDVIVDVAGISFVDGRAKYLPYNALTLWLGFMLRVPVIKLSQAMGPFLSPLNRAIAFATLSRCRYLFARGARTQQHLKELGIATARTCIASDLAFLFKVTDDLTHEGWNYARLVEGLTSERNVVGICPSSLVWSKSRASGLDYAAILARLVEHLVERGCNVVLFPHATRAKSRNNLRNNDLPIIQMITSQLPSAVQTHVIVVSEDISAAAIKVIVAQCRFVIVSRFHAMIAALSLGIPVIVVGWSHKYIEVMGDFGQEEFVLDSSTLNDEMLQDLVDMMLLSADVHAVRIASELPKVCASARNQFAKIQQILSDC